MRASPGAGVGEPDHKETIRGIAGTPEGGGRGIAANAAIYTAGIYAAQVGIFVGGIVQKGLLGPVATGYWALMETFAALLVIASLGASHGTSRQVPLRRGRGDYAGAAAVADTGSTFSVLAVATAGAAIALVAVAFGGGWAPEVRYGLVLVGLLAPLRLYVDAHEVLLQVTNRFPAVSSGVVVKSLIVLTVQTLLVYEFGYYGMFLGLAAATIGVFLFWSRLGLAGPKNPAFAWHVDRRWLREVIAFGLPILIYAQTWLLFMAVDNFIVAGLIDARNLGYYALAVSVTSYIMFLPTSIGAAVSPRMMEDFGETGRIESIRHLATRVQTTLAWLLLPIFVGAAFFLVPVLIRHALPAFEPAIPVVHIMVAGSFCLALTGMPVKMLLSAGYRWGLTGLEAVCLLMNAAMNYVAIAVLDWGLEGAAFATALSYFVTLLILTTYALSKAYERREVLVHLLEILAVFAYLLGALWGIEWLLGDGTGGVGADVAVGLLKFALLLVLLAPWMALAERRYQALTASLELARRARRTLRQLRRG